MAVKPNPRIFACKGCVSFNQRDAVRFHRSDRGLVAPFLQAFTQLNIPTRIENSK